MPYGVAAETASGSRPPSSGPVVLLAHGSPDPRHARDISALADRVRDLSPGRPLHVAYLDHHGPTPEDCGRAIAARRARGDEPVVLVPLLLSRAFHTKVDVPAAGRRLAAVAARRVVIVDALGPDPLIGHAIEELLDRHRSGPGDRATPGGGVLVYLAGSSRHEAVDDLVGAIRAGLPHGTLSAFATLDDYLPLDAAVASFAGAREVVAVSAMLAEGILRDRMIERCLTHGIRLIDGVLADTAAIARLTVDRSTPPPD